MKPIDFLFVYEIKAREFDSICLLRYELEKRGYTVDFVNTWQSVFEPKAPIEAKVVVVSACYSNEVLKYFTCFAKSNFNNVVNLQWEQVVASDTNKDPNSSWRITDIAKEAIHLCWGNDRKTFLTQKCGVKEENAIITGFIPFDFYRPGLNNYISRKEHEFSKYGLDTKKQTSLFISSFSLIGQPEIEYRGVRFGIDFDLYKKLSYKSRKKILEWFESALTQFPNDTIIYRPHPGEMHDEKLVSLSEKYQNFHVIYGESIKQWVPVVDKVYSWMSTSIAEVSVAKKECYILRPYEIPSEMDNPLYINCNAISTEKDFFSSLNADAEYTAPLQDGLLKKYYDISKEYSFVRVCDLLVNVIEKYPNNRDMLQALEKDEKANVKFAQLAQKMASSKVVFMLYRLGPYQIVGWLAKHTTLKWRIVADRRTRKSELPDQEKVKKDHLQYRKTKAKTNRFTEAEVQEKLLMFKKLLG